MTYHPTRNGAFVLELLGVLEPVAKAPRYDLRASSDGYEVTEYGQVIATFHGPQFSLAAKLLRMLKDDAGVLSQTRGGVL